MLRITAFTRDGVSQRCPGCGQMSDWTHSRYVRHVADETVSGRPVVIDLSVRRLYCENPACPTVRHPAQRRAGRGECVAGHCGVDDRLRGAAAEALHRQPAHPGRAPRAGGGG
ncbi:transposase family protein [Streptomyces sp. NPDC127166]|uniref:transposase family protein n=1 Tax=Streptomyces sp. NPDC127166 TaxID=3345380 RepID=UPI003628FADD